MSEKRRRRGEGGIRLRTDGRWEATLTLDSPDGKRRRRSFFGATPAEAASKLRDGHQRIEKNLPLPPQNLTVESHLRSWLIEKKKTLRPETHRAYSDRVRLYINPALGRRKLAKLSIADVQAFHASMGRRVSGTTAKHAHDVLRAALQDALRWDLVARNVVSLVRPPRRTTGEMRFLGPDDARDLMEAVKGNPLEACFVVALTCGLRSGELQALRWKDVELERRRLRVVATLTTVTDGEPVFGEPKTQHSRRTVWLSEMAFEALEAHQDRQEAQRKLAGPVWKEHGLVFTNDAGGPLWRSQIRKHWLDLLKAAKLPHLRVHDLRHTAATLLLAEGVPVKVASEMLGHSDVATTLRIYAHVIEGAQEQAASAMDRLFHA
ncbi:MAG TPA: site-specific integrase [Dehalococcoidia bacterium]|nr:site-specific integrase [Dehalococcoidia bacterium]